MKKVDIKEDERNKRMGKRAQGKIKEENKKQYKMSLSGSRRQKKRHVNM